MWQRFIVWLYQKYVVAPAIEAHINDVEEWEYYGEEWERPESDAPTLH